MSIRSLILILVCIPIAVVSAQVPQNVGDTTDGNRSTAVHLIKLYDEFEHVIKLDDTPVMPFSPRQTCAKCHAYDKIRKGWHFNAADSGVQAGRVGEPWILVDPWAATQIPLSYRQWKGTYAPGSVGLSTLKFLSVFGRHLPGGGVGENERAQDLNDYVRWQVAGNLDVNCQSCHNGDPSQSQAEYGVQVLRQNFRWAATASSGFATVQGSAGEMPDNFDLYSAVPPERSNLLPPTVHYNTSRFDHAGRVLFDVPREMPGAQCYFCHSAKIIGTAARERWEAEEDVHLAAGMTCVDCHRNGVDHLMVRGYDGETTGWSAAASLTCRGCHLGNTDGEGVVVGRRRAPRPQHVGIPPVHFENLTCTACHSGAWPAESAARVKTSRAHGLGIPKANKADDALPHIMTPVFAKQPDGVYAPHNMFWPAFWAYQHSDTLRPALPEAIRPLVREIYEKDTTRSVGRWPVLHDADVLTILNSLLAVDSTKGKPVYVSAGKLFMVGTDGHLTTEDHEAARPYAWPIAHDVRPKAQSLGIRGCDDCHATNAPFHFGSVLIASPYIAIVDSIAGMTQFQDQHALIPWAFSMSFLFRPWLKFLVIFSFLVIAVVIVIYGVRGVAYMIRTFAADDQ
jgi:hypothetical protein